MRRLYSSDRFREEERTDREAEMGAALQNNNGSCCMAALRLQEVFRLSGVGCSFEGYSCQILLGLRRRLCQLATHQRQLCCRSAPLSPRFGRRALQIAELALPHEKSTT